MRRHPGPGCQGGSFLDDTRHHSRRGIGPFAARTAIGEVDPRDGHRRYDRLDCEQRRMVAVAACPRCQEQGLWRRREPHGR